MSRPAGRYAYTVASPNYAPPGHLYRRREDAVNAARTEDGCGLRCGMRAVRVRMSADEFAAAK